MFTEREIQDIQDQLKAKAIEKGEWAETRYREGAKIILFRCTMCAQLDRSFLGPEDNSEIESLIREAFLTPRLHQCQESAGEHRKYGVLIPVGVLSKW
jgi:hypothetical protein